MMKTKNGSYWAFVGLSVLKIIQWERKGTNVSFRTLKENFAYCLNAFFGVGCKQCKYCISIHFNITAVCIDCEDGSSWNCSFLAVNAVI